MANADRLTPVEARAVSHAVARASEQGWGIAIGLLCGFSLLVGTFAATVGSSSSVGDPLRALAPYMPGYRISWPGAFIGSVYGFVGGYAVGRTIATVLNRVRPSRF